MYRYLVIYLLLTVLLACQDGQNHHTDSTIQPNSTQSDSSVSTQWKALGTEPFWAVIQQDSKYFRLERPDADPLLLSITAQKQAQDGTITYKLTGEAYQGSLIFSPQQCSDGMSDNIYTHSAILKLNHPDEPIEYKGCAQALPQP